MKGTDMTNTNGFYPGDSATFNTFQSDLLGLNGLTCKVIMPTPDNEYDRCETGPMYRIAVVLDVFEDELTIKED